MLIPNWPTAFVTIAGMISIVIIFINVIDRQKPIIHSRHCAACNKRIEEECRNNTFGGQPDE